ncbi:MAG: Gmad2 immunoglobulin-like domain-containing protein [Chloroflexi bacterium]|nr:Gmad2 immunoglobulin-like domain-containing protein [Chloroflexota bacterium]MCL5107840.1 Gmad2 immunoglobulin-like domain-containing protein [Chloroflexota bacterium]
MARLLLGMSAGLVLLLLFVACNPNAVQPTAKPAVTAAPATAKPAATAVKPAAVALPTPTGQRPIVVGEPKPQQTVKSPVHVSGLAIAFEGTVRVEVANAQGTVLGRGFTTASVGGPEVGTFSFDVQFTAPAQSGPGTVRVYADNPRDGSRVGLVEVPVTLSK